jgi:lipoprotein signal peptidase
MISAAILIGIALLAVLVDQASKTLVTAWLEPGRFHVVAGRLGLRRVEATRAGYVPLPRWVLGPGLLVLTSLIVVLLATMPNLPMPGCVGLGLLAGGATSNAVDRWARGVVVDFISVRGWRTLNIADACMVSGVLLTWGLLL